MRKGDVQVDVFGCRCTVWGRPFSILLQPGKPHQVLYWVVSDAGVVGWHAVSHPVECWSEGVSPPCCLCLPLHLLLHLGRPSGVGSRHSDAVFITSPVPCWKAGSSIISWDVSKPPRLGLRGYLKLDVFVCRSEIFLNTADLVKWVTPVGVRKDSGGKARENSFPRDGDP